MPYTMHCILLCNSVGTKHSTQTVNWSCAALGGGVPAPGAADDDDSDDDDSTVRSRVDGSPSLKRNELQTYDSTNSSVAGPLSGGLTIPSAATKSNDDPGNLLEHPEIMHLGHQ